MLLLFLLQASTTVTASSTASSASWLCLHHAVKAAVSPSWKTTYRLSTLCGTRSVLYVGWVDIAAVSLKKELTKSKLKKKRERKKKEPFACMQLILFRFDWSASSQGEGLLIYIIFASDISPPGKTLLLAGLISVKGILERYHFSSLWQCDVQTASLTYTTKQSEVI